MSSTRPSGRRLLLISNSTLHGSGYLDHAEGEIRDFLPEAPAVLFVPFALFDRDAYAEQARRRFEKMGLSLAGIHRAADPRRAVLEASALFIGGGNTFRLLKTLQDLSLLEPIRRRVAEEMPYIGSSAGAVISSPTIRTTNDMPIVEPPSLGALGLVAFQINAHYTDFHPPGFRGETRAERLAEFVALNPGVPVLGLPEGTMVRVRGTEARVLGTPTSAASVHVFGVPGVDSAEIGELLPFLATRS